MSKFDYTSVDGLYLDGNEVLATCVNSKAKIVPTNLVSNGTFESSDGWTLDTTWSIANGEASVVNNSGGVDYIYKTVTFPSAGTYLFELDITSRTTGTIYWSWTTGTATYTLGGGSSGTSAGKIHRYINVTVAGTIVMKITASDGTVASIDNVTCYNLNAETIGNDPAEIHTLANAASLTNEANATTGFTAANNALLTSVASPVSAGSYALSMETNTTPTNAGRVYIDLNAQFSLVSGQAYTLSFYIRHNGTGGLWSARIADATNASVADYVQITNVSNSDTTYTQYIYNFVYDINVNRYLVFRELSGTNDGGVYVDALSITKSNDLITNGVFYSETVSASWTLGTGWSISGGAAVKTAGTQSSLYQDNIVELNKTYTITFEIIAYTAGSVRIVLGGSTLGTYRSAVGTYTETITVTGTTGRFSLQGDAGFAGSIGGVSIYETGSNDLSANDNGLEIHGQLDLQSVAPGSELRAFSGFSADNYLEQPYTSALDFGTGDFSACMWVKMLGTPVSNNYLFNRDSTPASAQRIHAFVKTDGTIDFRVDDNTTVRNVISNTAIDDGEWHHLVFIYDYSVGGVYIYIDSVLDNSATGSTLLTISNSTAVLAVGITPFLTNPLDKGTIGNVSFYSSALTAAQIKTIYDSEKTLFQYGAPYAQVNATKSLEVPMRAGSSRGESDKKYTRETLTQDRQTLFYSGRDTFTPSTIPIPYISATQADYFAIKHLLNSIKRGQTFTFSERNNFDAFNESVNVILTSESHSINREADIIDYYTFDFTMREV